MATKIKWVVGALWALFTAACPPPWLSGFAGFLTGLVGGYLNEVWASIAIAVVAAGILGSRWLSHQLSRLTSIPEGAWPTPWDIICILTAISTAVIAEVALGLALLDIAWRASCFLRLLLGAGLTVLYWLGRSMWGDPHWGVILRHTFADRFNRGVYLARKHDRALYPFKNWVCSPRTRPSTSTPDFIGNAWDWACPYYRQLWYNPVFRPLWWILSLLITGPYKLRRCFYLKVWTPGRLWLVSTTLYQQLAVNVTLYWIYKWAELRQSILIYPALLVRDALIETYETLAYTWHRVPETPVRLRPLPPGSPLPYHPIGILLKLFWAPFPPRGRWRDRFGYYALWYHPDHAELRGAVEALFWIPSELRGLLYSELWQPAWRRVAWANPAPAAQWVFGRLPSRIQAALCRVAAHPAYGLARRCLGVPSYLWHRPPALPGLAIRYLKPVPRGGSELPLWATLPLRPWEGTRFSRHPAVRAVARVVLGAARRYQRINPWIRALISLAAFGALGGYVGIGPDVPPSAFELMCATKYKLWPIHVPGEAEAGGFL